MGRFIYQNVQNQILRNFHKKVGFHDLPKKVIREKTFFWKKVYFKLFFPTKSKKVSFFFAQNKN